MDYETRNRLIESEFHCDHERTALTKFTKVNGTTEFREQCLRCGAGVRTYRKTEVSYTRRYYAPEFDRQLAEDWRRRRSARYEELRAEERAEFDAEYDAYLRSPEWRRRRSLVLRRADGTCEGCGERPAVHVHHLTYEHVGNEFLFELVAVCAECHQAIHPDRQLAAVGVVRG